MKSRPHTPRANRRKPKAVQKAKPDYAVEQCWTLVGSLRSDIWHVRRVRCAAGQPASVTFDGAWVLKREEQHGDVQGFYHTHPSGTPRPSDRDVRTMRAWSSALGKPLLCVIDSPEGVAAFRFDCNERPAIRVERLQAFPRGVLVVVENEI